MKNLLKPLAKSVLIPLVLKTAAASAADEAIHKRCLDLVKRNQKILMKK